MSDSRPAKPLPNSPRELTETWFAGRRALMAERADEYRKLVATYGWKPRPPWWRWRERRAYDAERSIMNVIMAAYPQDGAR